MKTSFIPALIAIATRRTAKLSTNIIS